MVNLFVKSALHIGLICLSEIKDLDQRLELREGLAKAQKALLLCHRRAERRLTKNELSHLIQTVLAGTHQRNEFIGGLLVFDQCSKRTAKKGPSDDFAYELIVDASKRFNEHINLVGPQAFQLILQLRGQAVSATQLASLDVI